MTTVFNQVERSIDELIDFSEEDLLILLGSQAAPKDGIVYRLSALSETMPTGLAANTVATVKADFGIVEKAKKRAIKKKSANTDPTSSG